MAGPTLGVVTNRDPIWPGGGMLPAPMPGVITNRDPLPGMTPAPMPGGGSDGGTGGGGASGAPSAPDPDKPTSPSLNALAQQPPAMAQSVEAPDILRQGIGQRTPPSLEALFAGVRKVY